jgi:hypothetical protein
LFSITTYTAACSIDCSEFVCRKNSVPREMTHAYRTKEFKWNSQRGNLLGGGYTARYLADRYLNTKELLPLNTCMTYIQGSSTDVCSATKRRQESIRNDIDLY